jgi:hypothetical protein
MARLAGLGAAEIGTMFAQSRSSVLRTLGSIEGKRMLADLMEVRVKAFHEKAMDRLHAVQGEMVEELIFLAKEGESERNRLSAITNILDRAGTKVTEQQVNQQAPFIQVNIANMDSKHLDGMMPTSLVEGMQADNAILNEVEEVIDNGSESRDGVEGSENLDWAENQQSWQGGFDARKSGEGSPTLDEASEGEVTTFSDLITKEK